MACGPLRDGFVADGTFIKKNSTSATQNTPNGHLNIVTIRNPTHTPPHIQTTHGCRLGTAHGDGAISRKSLSGKDRPYTPWSPTDADIHQPT